MNLFATPQTRDTYLAYCPGPEPNVVQSPERKKQVAAIGNRLFAGQPVTEAEADILLESIVVQARKNIFSLPNSDPSLFGLCGEGQSLTAYPLVALGLPTKLLQLKYLPQSNSNHAVVATKIPISVDGETTYKTYLVDTTFRQYFTDLHFRNYQRGRQSFSPSIRQRLKKNSFPSAVLLNQLSSRDLCDDLLIKGYIDISNGAPGLNYFKAFNSGKPLDGSKFLEESPSIKAEYNRAKIESDFPHYPVSTEGGQKFPLSINGQPNGWINPERLDQGINHNKPMVIKPGSNVIRRLLGTVLSAS